MDVVSVPFRFSDTKGPKQLIKYGYFRLHNGGTIQKDAKKF
jgi:hypothetical protein